MKILHIAECEGVGWYLFMLLPLLKQRNQKQYFICSLNYDNETYDRIVVGVKKIDNVYDKKGRVAA